jgi:spore coat protein CotH
VNSDSAFQSAQETNEDNAPDFRLIRSFGDELEHADKSSVLQVIQKWMDVEKTLSLAAVSYTLDDDDGLFHWHQYSNGTVRPHNFYLYEEPTEKKIYLIPWDLDHMLRSVANPDINSAVELIDDWGEISNNCETFGSGWPQRSAACDKLIAGLAQNTNEYKRGLKKIDDGPFSGIESKLTEWENQLRPVTNILNSQNNNFISSDYWEYAVADSRQELLDARSRLREKLQ